MLDKAFTAPIVALICLAPSWAQSRSAAPATSYSYSTISFPGATTTKAYGVNKGGEIVGAYTVGLDESGFLDDHGTFRSLQYPSAITSLSGINTMGRVVGTASINRICCVGFEYFDGVFQTITFPGSLDTSAAGINDLGEIVGNYQDQNTKFFHGFSLRSGTFEKLDFPGAVWTFPLGINNSGEIVGFWATDTEEEGFLYSEGKWQNIAPGGLNGATVNGINNLGQIAGTASDLKGNYHGFVFSHGAFITLDFPGASETVVLGISDLGQVVGYYAGAGCGVYFGCSFLATPSN
jgi:probable HAF family extracellular repeat protein